MAEKPKELINTINEPIPINRIIELRNKGLTYEEIGELVGCTKENICQRLKPYRQEIENLKSFKEHRADVLAVHQARILNRLTEDDIKKASLVQKTTAMGTLYDKERLETNQSTINIAHAITIERQAELEELAALVGQKRIVEACEIPEAEVVDDEGSKGHDYLME